MDNKEASDAPEADPAIEAKIKELIAAGEALNAHPTNYLAVTAPRNPYRVEVNDQVAIYRRPKSSQLGMTCSTLMIVFGLILPSAFLMLLGFGVVSFPGETADIRSSGVRVLTLICTVVFTWLAINTFTTTGPQELRVSRTQKTYTLREAAPLRGLLKTLLFDRFTRADKGNPWRIVERSGPCSDMAGVSIQAVKGSAVGAQTFFWVRLQWADSTLQPFTLACIQDYASVGWGHAVALQAQAAEDLGIPTNPAPSNRQPG